MAKGDSNRAQQAIDTQGSLAQNYLTQVQGNIGNETQLAKQAYYGGGGYYDVPPPDPKVNAAIQQIIKNQGLQANQSDPKSLAIIAQQLQAQGINAAVDKTDENGHTGGITIDGHPYQ